MLVSEAAQARKRLGSTRRGPGAIKRANTQRKKTQVLTRIKPTASRKKRRAGLRELVPPRTWRMER